MWRTIPILSRENSAQFLDFIPKKSSAGSRRELNAKTAEFRKFEKRNGELNAIFKRLYKKYVLGKVISELFCMLVEGVQRRTVDNSRRDSMDDKGD